MMTRSLFPEELKTGGMLWFTDLTATDPLYILPIASAGTFLLLIEMGKEQMIASNAQHGQIMLNVFRGMSLFMIPVCLNFETAMLCYWTSNNLLTMAQTGILKTKSARKLFGIWDPPKPVPGQEVDSLVTAATKIVDRVQGKATSDDERIRMHNRKVDAKKKSFQMMKSSRERSRTGITGTKA